MSHKNTLRVYGRAELAQLYYGRPVTDNAALKWLMREINQYPGLYDRLLSLGFVSSQQSFSRLGIIKTSFASALGLTKTFKKSGKVFSCTQVAVIFNALGWPEA